MARPALKDRLFTTLCFLGAVIFLIAGVSRGNPRVAVVGALFFLGYAVLHSVSRRLQPAARLMSGSEADARERMVQFRAMRLTGQVALAVAAIGITLELTGERGEGVWMAGTALGLLAVFVGALWFFSSRTPAPAERAPRRR